MCGKQVLKTQHFQMEGDAGSQGVTVSWIQIQADPELSKMFKAIELLVLHTKFPDISIAQTNPCQAPCLVDPVIPTFHRCLVSLGENLLHWRVRWRKAFNVFLLSEMRNRSHNNSEFCRDHQLCSKLKKILHMEEALAPSKTSSH